jgi:hypothetical protein
MQRIGFTEGYGKRYDGPYAALVTNNIGDGCVLLTSTCLGFSDGA